MFTGFLAKMTTNLLDPTHTWTIFKDGSSNNQGNGASVILGKRVGLVMRVSLQFKIFATNNQVEYEAVIIKIMLAGEMMV